MGAFFNLEGLIEAGLEHVVDKGLGNPRFPLFHHYRNLQVKRLAVDDGRFGAGFHFDIGAVFDQRKHLGIVVPLHVGAKLLQRLVHRDHMRFATVRQYRRLPGAKQGDSQGQSRFMRGKNRAVCHCDLVLLLCCALPLRKSASVALSYQRRAIRRLFALARLFVRFASYAPGRE